MTRRVLIVGAGAAGMMAAIHAASATDVEVILAESTKDGGRKIVISGGGRCNVLPSEEASDRFVTDSSPNTLRKILRSWPLQEQREFFETTLNLELRLEPDSGKLFPASNRSIDVRNALEAAARGAGVQWNSGWKLAGIAPVESRWGCHFEGGQSVEADAVIVATGGLSVPKTGSDGVGLELAKQLGHEVTKTFPALTPLLTNDTGCHSLAGVSIEVSVEAGTGRKRVQRRGGFLFTHRGFSGPVILDLSHHIVRGDSQLRVRWVEGSDAEWSERLHAEGARPLRSILAEELPARLADFLLLRSEVDPHSKAAEIKRGARLALIENLLRWPLPVTGHEGYTKAEVTGGGVRLAEVDPRTLQSKRCPGLFFAGEILDAFGPIGGHNFAWAWATGRMAGRGVVEFLSRD